MKKPSDISQKVVVSVVYVTAIFMTVLDTTIVNVAIPAIARDFGESPDAIGIANVGFLVSLAVFISAAGWLGDRFGTKRMFMAALALFTLASALCGLAQNLPQLVGFRVLQGVGGGMLTPIGMAMMFRVFPPVERIRAGRYLVVPTALAPAAGPITGGLIVDHVSWHWVFYMNVPVGLAALVFGTLCLREEKQPGTGPFDLPGFLLAGGGLAGTLYALTEGSREGWASPLILGAGATGLLLLAALVFVETRTDHPMLDLRLLRNGLFRNGALIIVTSSAGYLGTVFVLPILIQQARGLEATDSGLTTFPAAIGMVIATQAVSRYYAKIGPRRITLIGIAGSSTMIGLLALVGPDTNLWWVRADLFLAGIFLAHTFMPAQTAAFAQIGGPDMGAASTLYNVHRQLGAAVGVAVLGSVMSAVGIFTSTPEGPHPHYPAYQWAFAVAGTLSALGLVFALRIKDHDAASTMVARVEKPAEHEAAR
ncbi:multidrug efflux MFS transporter [Yinghuangia sp. ASG 101]|uniref:MDR family MFS transporter n=1 Tax=Yinghuangia sp. ASG 101 TaxID=2896848 RepID=UPI001E386236|nr:MDR family MFS transporter [Yinghuangia sp. ASG 101]UGQ13812.1 multidrug efflux MFS transporter [Yinghuangia sp. ASG 101]